MKLKAVFTEIHRQNFWACHETVSGAGSTLEFTERLRVMLPKLIKRYKIKSLLDAGCGDWHWMSTLEFNIPVIGGEIVEKLVVENIQKYGGDFRVMDITEDKLPPVEAVLCRAVLFHLSNAHISLFLQNLKRSGIKYLLATTHPHVTENVEMADGGWRRVNLCLPPFGLPEPLFCEPDGPGDDGYLAVWRLK